MFKKIVFAFSLFVFIASCKNREASIPAYVTINEYGLETNYASEGTSSSKITTVWVEANRVDIGVFELPVTLPVIANGSTELTIYPGINLNGVTSLRNQYEFYNPYVKTMDIYPGDEITLTSPGKNKLITKYQSTTQIVKLEDFEGAGINFEKTSKSDTTLDVTSDSTEIFPTFGLNETNTKSGKVVMPKGNSLVEFESLQSVVLPQFGANVYLEVNYKCEVPVTFGVFANEPGRRIQAPVVTVLPTDEWKKIYINLVTEVSAYPSANHFDVFFGAVNSDATSEKTFYVDNLKLVYR